MMTRKKNPAMSFPIPLPLLAALLATVLAGCATTPNAPLIQRNPAVTAGVAQAGNAGSLAHGHASCH